MQVYDWTFYFESGTAIVVVPFGPAGEIIDSIDDEWIEQLNEYYPKLVKTLNKIPFEFLSVSQPRAAVPEEEHHWKELGYR